MCSEHRKESVCQKRKNKLLNFVSVYIYIYIGVRDAVNTESLSTLHLQSGFLEEKESFIESCWSLYYS